MTANNASASPAPGNAATNAANMWRSWRIWRHSRPFWAGLFGVLSGGELFMVTKVSLSGMVVHAGVAGISADYIGALMIMFGLSLWFAPNYRFFAGVAIILLAFVSFITTNLGGFVVGMLFGLASGTLAIAWAPDQRYRTDDGKRIRRPKPDAADAGIAESTATEVPVEGAGETAAEAPHEVPTTDWYAASQAETDTRPIDPVPGTYSAPPLENGPVTRPYTYEDEARRRGGEAEE